MIVLALAFALLTLATLATVALPLLRPAHAVADRGQYDRAVYRDQLNELDRDLARGVLSTAEAHSARLEIQRRLLAADGRSGTAEMRSVRSPLLAAGVTGFLLIASGALYMRLGSPTLPDVPFASRAESTATVVQGSKHLDMKDAAQKLRAKLAADPNDATGWVLYARTESMLGDFNSAGNAYKHAMALGQNGPDVRAGYGEMLVLAQQGVVPPEAREVFTQVVAADPKNDVARYYLALADAQAGEVKRAIAGWMSLAADIPEDSPMRPEIARQISDAAQSGGIPAPAMPKGTPPQTASAPDDAAAKAVEQMPPAEREKTIRSMVAQLAAKLQTQPNDVDGWMQLGRSYLALGEKEKAADAYQHAASLKPDDVTIKLREMEALLTGLKGSDPLPDRAVTLLHEVQTVSPNQPEALWYLGIVAARAGKPAEARDDWTRLLAQLPADGADAKMVKAALKQIEAEAGTK